MKLVAFTEILTILFFFSLVTLTFFLIVVAEAKTINSQKKKMARAKKFYTAEYICHV